MEFDFADEGDLDFSRICSKTAKHAKFIIDLPCLYSIWQDKIQILLHFQFLVINCILHRCHERAFDIPYLQKKS